MQKMRLDRMRYLIAPTFSSRSIVHVKETQYIEMKNNPTTKCFYVCCFQVYSLSNIDPQLCVCRMFVVPRFVLSLILFLFTFPEFCLLNFLQLSLWMTQFCAILFVCLSFCQNVCAAAWAEELERGGGGGRGRLGGRTTRQIQTNTTATSHSAQLPHQTNYWIFNSEQEKTEVWVNAILIIKNSFIEVILFRSMWLWKVLLGSITFILDK